MVLGSRAQQAFDLSQEPEKYRQRYGNQLWCQQALIARRLVEAGVSFVTIDMSYHTASGTWDNHGIPGGVYGGMTHLTGGLPDEWNVIKTTKRFKRWKKSLLKCCRPGLVSSGPT